MFVITADQIGGRSGTEQATEDPGAALGLVLQLARDREWFVGLGIGDTAGAGQLARDAAISARKRPTRFALSIAAGRLPDSELLEPLIICCCSCAPGARRRAGRSPTCSRPASPRSRRRRSSA
jgi:hypothetical protein